MKMNEKHDFIFADFCVLLRRKGKIGKVDSWNFAKILIFKLFEIVVNFSFMTILLVTVILGVVLRFLEGYNDIIAGCFSFGVQ